jgi:hypothetical protein
MLGLADVVNTRITAITSIKPGDRPGLCLDVRERIILGFDLKYSFANCDKSEYKSN